MAERDDAALMIGDTVFDMEMAVNAKVHAIGVDWGYHPVSYLKTAGARHIMSHFNELEPLLDAMWRPTSVAAGG